MCRGGFSFLIFGFSLPHTASLLPSHHPHTHSTLCRSMTVSCGFSGPAVTCVPLIYRHYSRQVNPEAPALSRQPGSSPAKAYLPLCRVGPCQVIQLYQAQWKQQQCISCTQMNSILCGRMSAYVPPLPVPPLLPCISCDMYWGQ